MPKADRATVLGRIQEVLHLVLKGYEWWNIKDHAQKAGWGVSERHLRRYLERAYQELERSIERRRERLITYAIARRRHLFLSAMAEKDLRTALAVLRDEADLFGLYPKKEVSPTRMSDEEVKREIDELLRRVGRPSEVADPPPGTGGKEPSPGIEDPSTGD